MIWTIFLLFTILAWGIYDLFFKTLSDEINFFLALLIIGTFQILLALPFVIYAYFNNNLTFTFRTFGLSAIMGILLGLGTIFFFYAFEHGAPASVAIPAYGIGVLLIGVAGGLIIFKETLNLRITIGFILGILSILLLTTNK